ncbi:hypothetical protein [Natranaerobius thermophilus]|uniref:BFD domain protein (2Fe-2S)-binding domain protein n=1 Tax=Natranaerobius thermophilus (strain ATCC BAA-1301 / DSM 18059 / JW/NM-WN-LF) TaxID=457570 RepID=B2A5U8_NATTJ|nr:hypothetical protein [Natranaerobius thermophilus]ACB84041.1 conserved hypothetical protein [Natranaerobius thermophilus JW/NM-WN-LF]
MGEKKRSELENMLKSEAVDGRISCAKCTEIAEKTNCALSEVGEVADELKLKIVKCQLGCF